MAMLERERKAALGKNPADIVLKNATYLNVFSKEWLTGDIAIVGEKIVGIGNYNGETEVDCTGKTVVPGFIDAHVHIESSMLAPGEFAKVLAKAGTTAIVADPHEIVNVRGKEAMEWFLEATEDLPISTYFMVPSSVPSTDVETNGAGEFLSSDMEAFLNHPRVLGLGETMRFMDVIDGEKRMRDKLGLFKNMHIDGHAPGLGGKAVQTYRLAGVESDHECTSAEEALEKLRAGFVIYLREGTGAKNVDAILPGLIEKNVDFTRCMFCTDDKHTEEIRKNGHISTCVRKALACGVDAAVAYNMGSFHAARHFGLSDLGAIAPGYKADLLILTDVDSVEIEWTMHHGNMLTQISYQKDYSIPVPQRLRRTVMLPEITEDDIAIDWAKEMHCIGMMPGELLTESQMVSVDAKEQNGRTVAVPNQKCNKLIVVERHGYDKQIGVSLASGMNVKGGAIATTVSHDSHNLIAVCDSDADALLAIRTLEEMEGGYVIVNAGKVVGKLPLRICGLMSDETSERVEETLGEMLCVARKMGVPETIDPFTNLSFMALTVIPELRLTERGLYDVLAGAFIKG